MADIALLAHAAETIPTTGIIMKKRYLLGAAALSVMLGCLESESTNEIQANERDGKYSWDRFATKIEDALSLWEKLKEEKAKERFQPDADEEFEDSVGNVVNKKTFEDLSRQGLL